MDTPSEKFPETPLRSFHWNGVLGLLLFVSWGVLLVDSCAPAASALRLIGTGLYLAVLLTPRTPRPLLIVTAIVLLLVPTLSALRAIPMYSMEWSGIDRVEVERFGRDHFEITDPGELKQLERFGARGSYQTMLKSGFGYHIYVGKGGSANGYYVHGDCFGSEPGGVMQSVCVPAEPGFMEWFESLCTRHGHPRHGAATQE